MRNMEAARAAGEIANTPQASAENRPSSCSAN